MPGRRNTYRHSHWHSGRHSGRNSSGTGGGRGQHRPHVPGGTTPVPGPRSSPASPPRSSAAVSTGLADNAFLVRRAAGQARLRLHRNRASVRADVIDFSERTRLTAQPLLIRAPRRLPWREFPYLKLPTAPRSLGDQILQQPPSLARGDSRPVLPVRDRRGVYQKVWIAVEKTLSAHLKSLPVNSHNYAMRMVPFNFHIT